MYFAGICGMMQAPCDRNGYLSIDFDQIVYRFIRRNAHQLRKCQALNRGSIVLEGHKLVLSTHGPC